MAGANLTSLAAALKEYYTPDAVQDMVYKDNPALAMIPKSEEFPGKYKDIPVIYGNPQGRSNTFSRAQARGLLTSTLVKEFNVTRITDYGVATIDNQTILATESDKGAFFQAHKKEFDGAINSLTRSLATKIYRGGYGEVGRIKVGSTVASATTITLEDIEEITNFEVGMELVVAAATSSGTLRALGSSGNGLIVTGVDRTGGVLTFGAAIDDSADGIPTIAHSDYLFIRGDREDAATPTRLALSGFEAWVPSTTPTSTAFFGMDRSVDPTRLGGQRYNATGVPIEEALIEAEKIVAREQGKIDHFFMSYDKVGQLKKALGAKVDYVDVEVGNISFRGLRYLGAKGDIKVVPDQNCPDNRCFGLTLDSWELASLGPMVRVIDTDSLEMLRLSTEDGFEYRIAFYGNLCCNAPGKNINIQW